MLEVIGSTAAAAAIAAAYLASPANAQWTLTKGGSTGVYVRSIQALS